MYLFVVGAILFTFTHSSNFHHFNFIIVLYELYNYYTLLFINLQRHVYNKVMKPDFCAIIKSIQKHVVLTPGEHYQLTVTRGATERYQNT